MRGQWTNHQTGSLPGSTRESERRPNLRQGGLRAAGIAGSRVAAPIVARGGGGVIGRLKAEWVAVAGAELAAATWPLALGRDGALKIRVVSSFALDLQHRAPLVIERINRFFGRSVVARLVLAQGPLPLPTPPRPAPPAPLAADEVKALDARLAEVTDPELRAALAGLGQLVLAGKGRGG